MVPGAIRRLSAFLLTLALVVGFAAHGVQAAHMGAAMAAAAMDPAMPDGCEGGDKAPLACSAMCAGYVAILPAPIFVETIEKKLQHNVVAVARVGLRGPPDPFPPRPSS
jgi:hypothetical protein